MKLLTILALILTLFIRCQAKTEDNQEEQDQSYTVTELSEPPADNYAEEEQSELKSSNPKNYEEPPVVSTVKFTPPSLLPEKVIRHAYLRMQVKDYATSTNTLKDYIAKRNAFISNAEEERADGNLQNTLTIRVDDKSFELLLADLQKESVYLEHKNITAKDVTEEYLDVNTRLKTKKKIEERYLALLARANNVKDILAIESELKSLQEEIESTEARQRYLLNQVAYSTITIDYFQTIPTATSPDNALSTRLKNALVEGWELSLYFVYEIIKLWPIWLLLFIMIAFFQRFRKSRLSISNNPSV